MKKLISVLVIVSVSIALFALDLNFGIDAMHNFDATATVSAHFDRLEVGGGVYTNAIGKVVAFATDSTNTSAFKDKVVSAFKTAEYGGLAHVYFDLIDAEAKIAVGAIADVGNISGIKEQIENKNISMNLLASAKASYLLRETLGLFAQVGLPVATFHISGSEKQFEHVIKGSGAEIWQYCKTNARVQFGLVLSI